MFTLPGRLAVQGSLVRDLRPGEGAPNAAAQPSAMPDAGKKRSYDEEDEPSGKKSRDNGDSKDNAVHVYQPCVVLPELAGKMNSLVEVCLAALVLGLCMHRPPPSDRRTPARRRCSFPQSI